MFQINDTVLYGAEGVFKIAEVTEMDFKNGKMAVLAEGDANDRPDITVLGKLPLFNPDGTPKA